MKKFINEIDNIIDEMLDGLVMANEKTIQRLNGFNVVHRKEIKKNNVSVISGGGSGHEPAHAGFVGLGMLDAAIAGDIFTSPTPDQILEAIKVSSQNSKKALLVVKNYTGDVMNFEIAIDLAKDEGIDCEMIVVDDDIALANSTSTTGKRGIAGTIFVHKVVGAAAEAGIDLQALKTVGEKVIKNVATMGISLDGCTVPANGHKGFTIPDDEVEVGLGIHGEPGIERIKLKSADEHVSDLMTNILSYLKLQANNKVAVLINGLGATPLMELNIIARKTLKILQEKNIAYDFVLVGNYMTAIDMPGFSISLLKLDDELETYLKKPAHTIALQVN